MIPKWSQNDSKMTPKWSPNGPKLTPKWSQNDSKLTPKWSQNDPQMIPKWYQNDTKMIPKWSQHDPKMIPKWSQNDFKMIPTCVYYSPGDRAQKIIPGGARTNESFWKFQNDVEKSIIRFPSDIRKVPVPKLKLRKLEFRWAKSPSTHFRQIKKIQN